MAVLLATLFFGLQPKDFDYSNNIHWVPGQNGIRTGRYGIAYTRPLRALAGPGKAEMQRFTVELAFKPLGARGDGFGDLLVLYAGDDDSQFVVGQWRSWLIAMNGADYVGSKKTSRIAVNAGLDRSTVRLMTLSVGPSDAEIYIDGRSVYRKRGVNLRLPVRGGTRLVLGNSPRGAHPWTGELYGLAIYGSRLSGNKIAAHYALWQKRSDFSFADQEKALMVYFFDEKSGDRVRDHSGTGRDLEIPSSMSTPDRQVLGADWERFASGPGMFDGLVNLLGFMPLGFVLTATFLAAGSVPRKSALSAAVVACFGVSLLIEIVQAGIPSRSSDRLDLLLNTCGALLGALIYRRLRKAWESRGRRLLTAES